MGGQIRRQLSPEACLLALGYLEPQQLMQVQENQAFRQWELWSLLSRCELQEGRAIALQAWGNQAFRQQEPWA
jgi:hypothetical protein